MISAIFTIQPKNMFVSENNYKIVVRNKTIEVMYTILTCISKTDSWKYVHNVSLYCSAFFVDGQFTFCKCKCSPKILNLASRVRRLFSRVPPNYVVMLSDTLKERIRQ